ncbi:hypothetical protein B9Z19DRAFT_1068954 [Tuber borchii]|uniref:Uncharacterized protein n=1 Tax=Tuber borchii TaxID=42251 RepID=A0A2T6ZDB1_TUBBO|nr:hypothetical protein B9Z19DRAFT_1068954 [Tuber borchii]
MANPCPTPYSYYKCSNPPFAGCCSVDPCSGLGCPLDSQYGSFVSTAPPITPASATPHPTETAQPSSSRSITSLTTLRNTRTITGPDGTVSTATSLIVSTAGLDATVSSTQQSPTASSTQLGGKGPGHSSSPPIVHYRDINWRVLIIFFYRRRRRRKSENSAGDLPTHGSVPEPTLDDGSATDERGGFLARLKRPRPTSIAKTTIELDSSPSTTHPEELPSPSFPSEHNSVIPGFAELPISSVSDLSSADRGVYSSTNVSTVSTGAVVSPHDTLRGGGRPAMMPNMVPGGRGRRKHTLSWQSFETGDGH